MKTGLLSLCQRTALFLIVGASVQCSDDDELPPALDPRGGVNPPVPNGPIVVTVPGTEPDGVGDRADRDATAGVGGGFAGAPVSGIAGDDFGNFGIGGADSNPFGPPAGASSNPFGGAGGSSSNPFGPPGGSSSNPFVGGAGGNPFPLGIGGAAPFLGDRDAFGGRGFERF